MRRITIELSEAGIANAIRELEQYRDDVENAVQDVEHRLAVIGRDKAEDNYAGSYNTLAGNTDVTVEAEGSKVVASGEDLMFNEFGAGTTAGQHPWAGKAPVDVSPGSWSATHAQEFTQRGRWYYNDVRYTNIFPSRSLYLAFSYMRQNVQRIAREVFDNFV